jgi:hypothetical protein
MPLSPFAARTMAWPGFDQAHRGLPQNPSLAVGTLSTTHRRTIRTTNPAGKQGETNSPAPLRRSSGWGSGVRYYGGSSSSDWRVIPSASRCRAVDLVEGKSRFASMRFREQSNQAVAIAPALGCKALLERVKRSAVVVGPTTLYRRRVFTFLDNAHMQAIINGLRRRGRGAHNPRRT